MTPSRRTRLAAAAAAAALAAVGVAGWWATRAPLDRLGAGSDDAGARRSSGRVSFNRDVRPILNQNCTGCHGGVKAQAGVSFVFREGAMGVGESGRRTIIPGNPGASEMIRRVSSTDPDYRMPEADHAPPLSPEQIALLRRWVDDGAEWEEPWAFVAPKPQRVPRVARADWAHGPVDQLVLARLEREALAPSPEADRAALLRRVSLDLTGLPPTPEELAAFLADRSADAYERQVDRLLASPHYGERWAAHWLDLARYADTKGYESDRGRSTWPYRDWVVGAFNRNLPYDRFVTEQLAGDLLPDATLDQIVATSFHRQTPVNDEGGTDDEEFRVAAVIDRVGTTWAAVNGVTFGCAQCHAHPYDPIRHDEFYRFAAFFNNTRDADHFNDQPVIRVPRDSARAAEVFRLQRERQTLYRATVDSGVALAAAARAWTRVPVAAASAAFTDDSGTAPLPVTFDLRAGEVRVQGTVRSGSHYDLVARPDPSTLAAVTALRLEVPPQNEGKARHTPEPGFVVTQVEAWVVRADGREEPVSFRHYARDSYDPIPSAPRPRRVVVAAPAGARRRRQAPAPPATPPAVVTPSGFGADPKLSRTRWMVAIPVEPLRLTTGDHIKLRLTHDLNSARRPLERLRLSASADPRWTALGASPGIARQLARIDTLRQRIDSVPATLLPVMEELPPRERRETRLFVRGNFLDKTGAPLAPDVPAVFPPLPKDAPRDRLTLARWLFAPGHPLTARVAVNRYWEQLFGVGLVETLEDFGSVGEPPSHPELLDWLALHFQNDLRWDQKRLLRELVTSATYRQSARATPELLAKDPRNRLLARGPRQRLTAEMVRDQALLASGLLSRKMGGPPVMPPQPEGVWQSVYNDAKWVDAQGEDRYRRAVYTYLKRSSPYPSMLTFDGSARDVSLLRRIHTNTPLQALVTLNDPVYHEAATALAARMRAAAGEPGARLAFGMRATVSREPTAAELAVLRRLYDDVLQESAGGRAAASSADRELAALTAAASAMLNLDAALSR